MVEEKRDTIDFSITIADPNAYEVLDDTTAPKLPKFDSLGPDFPAFVGVGVVVSGVCDSEMAKVV